MKNTRQQIQELENQAKKLQEQIQELKKNLEQIDRNLPDQLKSGQVYEINNPNSCYYKDKYLLLLTSFVKGEVGFTLISINLHFTKRWCEPTNEQEMNKTLIRGNFAYLGMFKDLYTLQEK